MRCTDPRTVGFRADGKTLAWSYKDHNKQYSTFQLPCNQCLECRLEYARQWAVRCVHESMIHPEHCFITLTYADEHLGNPKLDYDDFQKFAKRLRRAFPNQTISYFVTGEYGEKNTKRKHWHAIIFNWAPRDGIPKRTTHDEHTAYSSATLDKIWGKGITEYGTVTFDSAGYCARYAAKKIVHGTGKIKDAEKHEYQPISKKSSKRAIGRGWLEKFWPDAFNHGRIVLPNGKTCSIPRYYEKWLKQHQPAAWNDYVTHTKTQKSEEVILKEEKRKKEEKEINMRRSHRHGPVISKNKVRATITKQKFEELQKHLKL